eukprot:6055686-Amphidinium_carterae.1
MASDGTYHPKYDLNHTSSRDTVWTFLQALSDHMDGTTTGIAVTVTGRNVDGVLHDVVITQCTNTDPYVDATSQFERGCDSVCTGACSGMGLTIPASWSTATVTTTTASGDTDA